MKGEILEFNDDGVDDFNQLNCIYRDTYDWINNSDFNVTKQESSLEINKNIVDPKEIFKLLNLPDKSKDHKLDFEVEYVSRKTEPNSRLLTLKHELRDCINEIDDYVETFKSNSYIISQDSLPKLYEDIKAYKSKVDSFIDYKIFEKTANDKIEEDGSASFNDDSKASTSKQELNSINQKNEILTKTLISKVKLIEQQLVETKDSNLNIKYEIISSPENDIESLASKLNNLDTQISNLERTIGEWSLYDNGQSICSTLNKLLEFLNSKVGEKYEKKYQTSKDCGTLINKFVEQKKDQLVIGSYFVKIKELYSVLELCENFDQVFEYLKKRFSAIKTIHEQSDQFGSMISNLTKSMTVTEEKYKSLLTLYDETITEFQTFEKLMTEINELDSLLKSKFLV